MLRDMCSTDHLFKSGEYRGTGSLFAIPTRLFLLRHEGDLIASLITSPTIDIYELSFSFQHFSTFQSNLPPSDFVYLKPSIRSNHQAHNNLQTGLSVVLYLHWKKECHWTRSHSFWHWISVRVRCMDTVTARPSEKRGKPAFIHALGPAGSRLRTSPNQRPPSNIFMRCRWPKIIITLSPFSDIVTRMQLWKSKIWPSVKPLDQDYTPKAHWSKLHFRGVDFFCYIWWMALGVPLFGNHFASPSPPEQSRRCTVEGASLNKAGVNNYFGLLFLPENCETTLPKSVLFRVIY